MTIRRTEIRDIPQIMELLKQVESAHQKGRPDIFKKNGTKYTADELKNIISDDKRPIFVADDNGKIAGYGFCVFQITSESTLMCDMKTLYIDDICVDSNKRGKGVGTKIYNYIIDFAKKNGFYNVTLNVWECNPEAKKFYENLGLKPYKTGMETIL